MMMQAAFGGKHRCLSAATLAALLICGDAYLQPAVAADPLLSMLPAVAREVPDSGILFSYASPGLPLAKDPLVIAMLQDRPAGFQALAQLEAAEKLTGIALGSISAAFTTGDPPSQSVMVAGAPGWTDRAATSLTGRGFAASQDGSFATFARGEDFIRDFDVASREPADPFGQATGMAQRIGISGNRVLVTNNWASYRAAAARLDGREASPVGTALQHMVEAALTEAGPRSAVLAAGAYSAAPFVVGRGPVDLIIENLGNGEAPDMDALTGKLEAQAQRVNALPPFQLAVQAACQTTEGALLAVVVLYSDEGAATTGASELVKRLAGLMPKVQRDQPEPKASIVKVAEGVAAVVTARYPSRDAAITEYKLWLDAQARRESFLSLAP
jgi:hypothetical protein